MEPIRKTESVPVEDHGDSSPSNQFVALDDYQIQTLGHRLIREEKYQCLINWMLTEKRIWRLCQPLLILEHQRLIDRPPTLIQPNGIQEWHDAQGNRHRDGDQHAVTFADGVQAWYQHGFLHRDGDQPAIIDPDGTQFWYQHGLVHRDGDQPAIIDPDGTHKWYQHGKLHRDGDQPAVITSDGKQMWYQNGLQMGNKTPHDPPKK